MNAIAVTGPIPGAGPSRATLRPSGAPQHTCQPTPLRGAAEFRRYPAQM
jgi:hypothetical protein